MEPTPCRVCEKPALGALCTACNTALGIVTEPGLGRPPRPCGRCSGTLFIRAQPREHTRMAGEHGPQASYPMAVTHAVVLSRAFFSGEVTGTRFADASAAFGILDMYVCRACGLTEWYCRDPQNIPITPECATELVEVAPSDGPFR